jgi:hypothetical protein
VYAMPASNLSRTCEQPRYRPIPTASPVNSMIVHVYTATLDVAMRFGGVVEGWRFASWILPYLATNTGQHSAAAAL